MNRLRLSIEGLKDSLYLLFKDGVENGIEDHIKASRSLIDEVKSGGGSIRGMEDAVSEACRLLSVILEDIESSHTYAALEVIGWVFRAIGALCRYGEKVQSLILEHEVHLGVSKILIKESVQGYTKFNDLFTAGLNMLINITFGNSLSRDRLMKDTCEGMFPLAEIMETGRKHELEETGLVLVNCVLVGSVERGRTFINSECSAHIIKEMLQVWREDTGPNAVLDELVISIFRVLLESGVIDKCADTNMKFDEEMSFVTSILGVLEELLCVRKEFHSEWESTVTHLGTLLHLLVTSAFLDPGFLTQENKLRDAIYATRAVLRILSEILQKVDEKIKIAISQMHAPRDLLDIILVSNQISPRRTIKKSQDFSSSELFNFKSEIVFCVAALADNCQAAKGVFASLEIMPVIMNLCSIDAINPVLREYSILAIKILCEDCPANAKFIGALTPMTLDAESSSLINEYSEGRLSVSLSSGGEVEMSRNKLP